MRVKFFATLCLMAAATMMSVVQPLSAQSNIGLVDVQTALLATAEMQKEADKLEVEFSSRQESLAALADEISALRVRILASNDAQAQASMEAEMARNERRFERDRQDLQAAIDFRRDGIVQKGAVKMRDVLEALRLEKGFDLIVDSSMIYVFDPALNLTIEATAAYNAAHPVAAN